MKLGKYKTKINLLKLKVKTNFIINLFLWKSRFVLKIMLRTLKTHEVRYHNQHLLK